ncbi:TatD family hydrolase [bacterium]|nr:TatD family hydrolase [bacterium]
MIAYTDTHCHLDFDRFDADRERVLKRAWKAGLTWILNPAVDLESGQAAIDLAQSYPGKISAAVGIHPNFGKPWTADILSTLRKQAAKPEVVAIGEIGLDYYRQHTPRDQQKMMLSTQLNLAAELHLPVVIHNRESTKDLLTILSEWHASLAREGHPLAERPGVLHSYSADLEAAQEAIGMNFYLGITGPVTFTNAPDRKAVVRNLPLDHLLLETDAPFLTPHPHRGERNEPAYIPLIAEEIARLHNKSPKEVAEITTANARTLFAWNN